MTPGKVTILNAADLVKLGSIDQPHHDLAVEWVDVGELTLFPGNARLGVPEKIAESIRLNGFFDPLKVQRSTGYVIAGNHSYKAAMDRGMKQVPVVYLDVDDDRAKRMNLVHNKLQDDATYDPESLTDQLLALDDLDGTGWTEEELAALTGDLEDDGIGDDDLGTEKKIQAVACPNCSHEFDPSEHRIEY
jgi:hypothetical protein